MRPALVTVVVALVVLVLPAGAHDEPGADEAFLNIAHRGASRYAPELTMAAFDGAVERGADYLELDVQVSVDGTLVVIHDETLGRTARGPAGSCSGRVDTKTLAQLKTCDVGSWFADRYPHRPSFAGERIPTVAEVFERYGSGVSYLIELKSPEHSPGLAELLLLRLLDTHDLREEAVEQGRVVVQSFSRNDLLLLRALDPELPLVQLLAAVPSPADRHSVLDVVAGYADWIAPAAGLVDAEFVEAAHGRCLAVTPYTVDGADRMRTLIDAGVDGIITNRPHRLHRVLGRSAVAGRGDAARLTREAGRACGER